MMVFALSLVCLVFLLNCTKGREVLNASMPDLNNNSTNPIEVITENTIEIHESDDVIFRRHVLHLKSRNIPIPWVLIPTLFLNVFLETPPFLLSVWRFYLFLLYPF